MTIMFYILTDWYASGEPVDYGRSGDVSLEFSVV